MDGAARYPHATGTNILDLSLLFFLLLLPHLRYLSLICPAMPTHSLQYSPWTSDIELAFYSALANIKLNHDRLDNSARKVLGLYELNNRDAPERSTRMQIHSNALTTDEYVS